MTETKTFNLSRAQKYLDKLNTKVNSLNTNTQINTRGRRKYNSYDSNENKFFIEVRELIDLSNTEEELKENYNKMVNNIREGLTQKIHITQDYKNFKNAVYTLNANCGLSKILTQIDLLNEEKNVYSEIKSQIQSENFMPESKLSDLALIINNDSYHSSDSINNLKMKVYDLETIDNKLKQIHRSLEELENSRDKINANTTITFEFHQESLDLLGI